MLNTIDRIKLLFRKDKGLYVSLYRILGFYPRKITLYKRALAHSSTAGLSESGVRIDNERLEFLGDAIIEAAMSDIVFCHFAQKDEGFLSTTRSKLVQRSTLNHLADEVGLSKLVHSSGSAKGRNSSVMGNAFEALVGAIYLDRGYDYCVWFLRHRILTEHLNLDKAAKKEVNFKSKLLEWAQKNRFMTEFSLSDSQETGGNAQVFRSCVAIEGVTCGQGDGYSKKESQQKASREALRRLRQEKGLLDAILKAKEKRTATEENLTTALPETEGCLVVPHSRTPQTKLKESANSAADCTPAGKREPETESGSLKPFIDRKSEDCDLAEEDAKEGIVAEAEAKAFSENGEAET